MAGVTVSAGGASTASLRRSRRRVLPIAPALVVAAFASIGAGAIHAAAIGVHSEHRQAVVTFTLVATVQIGWGVLALAVRNRRLVLFGAIANAAIVGGWFLAKTGGIAFVDGLEASEGAQFADSLAAGLAVLAVVGALAALATRLRPRPIGHTAIAVVALAAAVVAIPGMVSAGSHSHALARDHGDEGHEVAPVAYDPRKPIDLGGVRGVTPRQQARAENLVAVTVLRLPQFSDPAVAEARGFRSIGDSVIGAEHYINRAYFDDGRILDPDHPESLVYEPQPDGTKKLAAAMFILPAGRTLDDVPDVGGKLMQWHGHHDPCAPEPADDAGVGTPPGTCAPNFFPTIDAPMIHVWIRSHPCGPFAALEGSAGGEIRAGETRLCDRAHGSGHSHGGA